MTRGERLIGHFSNDTTTYVPTIKNKFIDLIDFIDNATKPVAGDSVSKEKVGDIERLRSIAFTKLEEACMFAVKAKMHFS